LPDSPSPQGQAFAPSPPPPLQSPSRLPGSPSSGSAPLKISREPFTRELADEIAPLGQKSWDECSEIKKDTCSFHGERGFRIEPDVAQYLNLAAHESLLAMTLRDESGRLCGYCLSVLYHSLHHAPVKCANVDTFYIEPAHRIYMRSFIAEMEGEFRERGIVVVGWPTSPDGKLFDILRLLGYAPDDVVMEKRICPMV
jgi:hypothetical protein